MSSERPEVGGGKKPYRVTLESRVGRTWAVPAALSLLQDQAKLCGLPNVYGVSINLIVQVEGDATPEQLEELSYRLDALSLGSVLDAKEVDRE